jgi:hypothetical protein
MRDVARRLVLAAHAIAGLGVAAAVWTACGLMLAAHGGVAGPAFAWARPLVAAAAGCAGGAPRVPAREAWRHAAAR